MKYKKLLLLLLCLSTLSLNAQLVINEGSNRNATQIADEDGEYDDWLELYNSSSSAINLNGYTLTDDSTNLAKWIFPTATLNPNQFLLVYLSGKNRAIVPTSINHWETFIATNEIWEYDIPSSQPASNWNQVGFSAIPAWATGKCGIGYGDNDDSTVVTPNIYSVYLRHEFNLSDTSKLGAAILDIDYDDGFVAYINGVEVARSGLTGTPPAFDELAADHEAIMYQGGNPEEFVLDWNLVKTLLQNGTNVLAIECHNFTQNSSDLSIIPFLTFGIKDNSNQGGMTPPTWFSQSTNNNYIFHTNFKIKVGGEKVWLIDNGGQILDKLLISVPEIEHSVGSISDGNSTKGFFATATPNASNNTATAFSAYAQPPVFSQNAGFYTNQINTSLTCPDPNATIHYTTNGQIPLISDPLYTSSLTITQTTPVKARCFATNLLPSRVATNTYFINDTIVNIPTISITTNTDNLYGATGIYDNWWTDWKRHCYIEFFDSLGVNQFEQNAGIKIDGGAGGSRSNAQKSFRIEPDNSIFGDSILRFPIIPDAADENGNFIKRYETFYLRNGSNMYNVLPYKDAWMVGLMKGTNVSYSAYHPVAVFLNGEYWGMYELREKQDKGYVRSHYNANQDSLDMLSLSYWYNGVLRTVNGSDTSYYNMMNFFANYPNPASSAFLIEANKRLDLNNYTDYIIAETFFGNTDWPHNNLKMYRFRDLDRRWNFGLIDVEWGLGVNGWTDVNYDMINHILNPWLGGHELVTDFWLKLLQNNTYKNFFLNRYADLLNTTLKPYRVIHRELPIYQKFQDNFPRHLAKWGDGSSIPNQMNTYYYYRDVLTQDLLARPDISRTHLRNNFQLVKNVNVTLNANPPGAGYIKISTLTIPTDSLPWTGIYFDGVPVSVTAVANYGYQFTNWSPNAFISSPTSTGFTANITANSTNFTANFVAVQTPETMTVSEVNYQSEPSRDAGDWVEFHNYGTAPISLNQWYFTDSDSTQQFCQYSPFL